MQLGIAKTNKNGESVYKQVLMQDPLLMIPDLDYSWGSYLTRKQCGTLDFGVIVANTQNLPEKAMYLLENLPMLLNQTILAQRPQDIEQVCQRMKDSDIFDRETAEATFPIVLKDFTYVVIGNLGILYKDIYPGLDDCEEFYYYLGDIFRNRHKERHIGNLGKGEDEIHNKHIENVDKINGRRLAEKLSPFVDEIVDEAEDLMYKVTIMGVGPVNKKSYCSVWLDEEGLSTTSGNISLGGHEYKLVLKYKNKWSNIKKSDDTFDYYDLYHELEHFAVIKHEDGKFTAATNEDLGITKETHKNLFQTYIVKNARASRKFYRQEDPRDRGRKGHYLVEPDDPNRIID